MLFVVFVGTIIIFIKIFFMCDVFLFNAANLNAALGGSIGGILGLALLAVVIIITVVMVKKRAEIHKEHQRM